MTTTNPLIAPRVDTTKPWSGIFIAEDIEGLASGFRSGDWVDITIGGVAASLDLLALVVDPYGELGAYFFAMLMEHLKPLSDALDALAGDPDQITAYAQTWHNAAGAIESAGIDLRAAVDRETIDWAGKAANNYRDHAAEQLAAMLALKNAYNTIGEIVHGAGVMVAFARGLVRDYIAEGISTLVIRLPMWLAAEGASGGLATPLVLGQAAALIAKIGGRVARVLTGVIKSLARLLPILRRLDDLIRALRLLLGRLKRTPHASSGGGAGHPPGPPGSHPHPHPHTTDEVEDIIEGIVEADTPQPGHPGGPPHLDRGHAGEQGMGFHYSQEKGWAFLEGPSGSGGHQSSHHGFDGVAYRTEGPLEIHVLDNKSLKAEGNVSSSTALTRNLEQNLDRLIQRANDPAMDGAPRIQEIRQALAEARAAVAEGRPLPPSVHLVVTGEGGRSTGVTDRLRQQGVEFRDTR